MTSSFVGTNFLIWGGSMFTFVMIVTWCLFSIDHRSEGVKTSISGKIENNHNDLGAKKDQLFNCAIVIIACSFLTISTLCFNQSVHNYIEKNTTLEKYIVTKQYEEGKAKQLIEDPIFFTYTGSKLVTYVKEGKKEVILITIRQVNKNNLMLLINLLVNIPIFALIFISLRWALSFIFWQVVARVVNDDRANENE